MGFIVQKVLFNFEQSTFLLNNIGFIEQKALFNLEQALF